jgi:hypothetical protein
MVIANVPTPIALPFAYFPMSKETSISGLILPSYNDSNTRVSHCKTVAIILR